MTARVVGLDLSLTATGMAAVWMDQPGRMTFECTSIATKGRREDTLTQRNDRINHITLRVWDFAAHADLVVVEGPSVMSKGGSNWDRAGLWWSVLSTLLNSGRVVPVAVAPPTVVKKWAAGKGNADKAAVAVGVARLWDQFECESDNEADALALASMGAQRLGLPVPSRAHHAEALVKVAWPDGLVQVGSSVERAS